MPEELAETVILVGDQNRVAEVSKYFDKIEVRKAKREFITHTGYVGNKRISVVSTGIGTDNIDIVLNELDALANINLKTREVKSIPSSLKLIRIGTSGSLQDNLQVNDILVSSYGLGLDSLMQFYDYEENDEISNMLNAIDEQLELLFVNPYLFKAPGDLFAQFSKHFNFGITATCCGFYAPQGRMLRAEAKYEDLIKRLSNIEVNGLTINNFEMETAAIYGMATLLGHEAVSVNAILANRINHTFSSNPGLIVESAIKRVLEII
jgi:uridine phosphorylase